MRRQRIQLILLLLLYLKSKVIVIDDVGATKQFGPDKKDLVDKVRKKINSGNEEVVIYGKNKRNRNIRISSNDIDPNAKLKKEKELKDNRIRLNNQKIINSLKRLVNEQSKMPTRKPRRRRRLKNNNIKQNFPETINNNPQNIDDKEPKVEIDEPVVENLSFDFPEDHTRDNDTTPNPETSLVKSPLFDFDPINDLSSLFKPKNNYFDDFLSSYKPQTSKNDFLPNFTPKTEDPFKINDKTPDFNKDTPAFDSLLPSNSINKDNISLLKDQENKNLLRAINNRKEYLRIKIEEVNNKKDNIARQLSDYKKKIEDLFNRINTTRNLRDKLYTKMNMEKSHITNLNMISKEIKEKEGKLKDMIRSSRDQIIQYKSFLENEMAKLDVLEKQYEVYENTLKRYNDDCIEENNNLLKVKNDLTKYEKDLKDLNEIFSNFKCKHYNLNDELNRQSKIESDLEMEKDKVNRNGLSGLF